MSDGRRSEALGKIGAAVSGAIDDGAVVGLGSGTTMAAVLPAVVRELESRAVRARWVPTSLQIALVAQSLGQDVVSIDRPVLDLVVDGADQVDSGLNLIKGGGG
ncbi:MAG: ribose-5-phosphate isomerase A, partial [Nitrososphaerales archaeon]